MNTLKEISKLSESLHVKTCTKCGKTKHGNDIDINNSWCQSCIYSEVKKKKCSKCGEVKALSEFNKDKSNKNGYASVCRSCKIEYSRNHYNKNKAKLAEKQRDYKEKNRDKVNEAARKYVRENNNKINKYRRELRKKDTDKARRTDREYHKKNRDIITGRRTKKRESLSDAYVRNILVNVFCIDKNIITQEMIEIKRLEMTLKRLIK